jgi:translocation and assembly module TamB
VRPDGFDAWQLDQSPELKFSASGGRVDAHCWKQAAAGICIDAGSWDTEAFQGAVLVDGFALAALQPLLAAGYKLDGTVDANLKFRGDSAGLRGELHWRQSHTVLGYADDIDEFYTELDEVQIDLVSTDEQTDFSATISGEAGLTLVATAKVNGPLLEGSPIVAAANGRVPSIGLLRPLLQRVIHPGELQGKLTIDLDVGGTLGDPVFSGGANLADGALGLVGAGITLTDINIVAKSATSDRLQLTGQLRSGEGSAEIKGDIHSEVNAEGIPGLVADISIKGENLASVRTPDLTVDTSPNLSLKIGRGMFDISGVLNIPNARAQIHDLPRNAIARSDDVIVHIPEREVDEQGGTLVTGDVVVELGDDVRFNGFGLDSRLEGSLKLTQNRGGYLLSNGTVRVLDGFLIGYGKELRVDRGTLTFIGPLDDPLINIQVSRESFYEGRQYTVGLRLTGSAQNVKTEPFSRPAMSDNDVLSFLLIDQPTGSGADASGAALALGLGQLFPGDGGMLGLDEVGFETNDANEAAMVAGKRINDKVYVRYVFGSLGEPGAFRIRYRLGRGFSLEASTGARQSLDIIYLLER